jgi:hypothetical protein
MVSQVMRGILDSLIPDKKTERLPVYTIDPKIGFGIIAEYEQRWVAVSGRTGLLTRTQLVRSIALGPGEMHVDQDTGTLTLHQQHTSSPCGRRATYCMCCTDSCKPNSKACSNLQP